MEGKFTRFLGGSCDAQKMSEVWGLGTCILSIQLCLQDNVGGYLITQIPLCPSIEIDLRCLLPKCAVLEWLSLTRCRLDELSIGEELSRLHCLQVKYCMLQKLHVRAPNLTMFVFAGRVIPILLGESVKISEATVDLVTSSDCFSYVFTDLVDALSHVPSLSIGFRIETKVCTLNTGRCLPS